MHGLGRLADGFQVRMTNLNKHPFVAAGLRVVPLVLNETKSAFDPARRVRFEAL